MYSMVVIGISLVINTILFFLMYKGVYIPSGKTPFFIGLGVTVIYYAVGYVFGEMRSQRTSRLFIFTITLYVAYSLSGLTYAQWKWDTLISPLSMMKISLVVFVISIIYLNVLYVRAEISYKRKRGNIRIQKEQPKSQIDKWRERKKGEDEHEISIQLGHSTESEEKTPPI